VCLVTLWVPVGLLAPVGRLALKAPVVRQLPVVPVGLLALKAPVVRQLPVVPVALARRVPVDPGRGRGRTCRRLRPGRRPGGPARFPGTPGRPRRRALVGAAGGCWPPWP